MGWNQKKKNARHIQYLRSLVDDFISVLSPLLEVADGVVVDGQQVAEEGVDVAVASVFVLGLHRVEIHLGRHDLPVVRDLTTGKRGKRKRKRKKRKI